MKTCTQVISNFTYHILTTYATYSYGHIHVGHAVPTSQESVIFIPIAHNQENSVVYSLLWSNISTSILLDSIESVSTRMVVVPLTVVY